MKLFMLDNYDSFTWNLVQYFGELGASVQVVRNDQTTPADIEAASPDIIVISPGPCTPDDAGISIELVRALAGKIPILGVCLGHQSIAAAFGARIVRAKRIMHGKTSPILHDNSGIFASLPNPFEATRYHSLVIDRATLPPELKVTAWTSENEIMGIRHATLPVAGVQFHPESILTDVGKALLSNFMEGAK